MEKLTRLISYCKCGVHVDINIHRDYYQTAEQALKEKFEIDPDLEKQIEPEIIKRMIELNTIVDVQFYPSNPVGSYSIYHYDIDLALDEAIELAKAEFEADKALEEWKKDNPDKADRVRNVSVFTKLSSENDEDVVMSDKQYPDLAKIVNNFQDRISKDSGYPKKILFGHESGTFPRVDEISNIHIYYIWSFEHNAWWKSNSNGYTQNLDEAGSYSASEAKRICEDANRFSDRINEEMILITDVERILEVQGDR